MANSSRDMCVKLRARPWQPIAPWWNSSGFTLLCRPHDWDECTTGCNSLSCPWTPEKSQHLRQSHQNNCTQEQPWVCPALWRIQSSLLFTQRVNIFVHQAPQGYAPHLSIYGEVCSEVHLRIQVQVILRTKSKTAKTPSSALFVARIFKSGQLLVTIPRWTFNLFADRMGTNAEQWFSRPMTGFSKTQYIISYLESLYPK